MNRDILSALDIGTQEVGSLGTLSERGAVHVVAVNTGVLLVFLVCATGKGKEGGGGKNRQGMKTHEPIHGQKVKKIKNRRVKNSTAQVHLGGVTASRSAR